MGTAAGEQPPAPERRSVGSGFDLNGAVATMITNARGNAKAVIRHLVREGRRYRLRIKDMERDLATRPLALKEGEVVLDKEAATRWTALKDIKLTPEQITQSLKKKDELESESLLRKQDELVIKSAKDLGIKRPTLLAEQVRFKNMVVEDREVEVVGTDGKRTKEMQVHVRAAGDDKAPWRPMKEFLEKDLKDWTPALMAEDESKDDRQEEEATVMYPAQRGARGRAPVKDPVVKVIGDKYVSPSELKKQSTSQGA